MRLPEFDRPSRLPPNPYVITHDLFLSPACAGLVAVSPTTHVVAAFWNRRCLARCRRRLGRAYRAQTRGGSLLHHVPNRPPRFPTSAPPPGPSAHPSGFSIRSQQGSALAFGSAIPSAFRPRPSKQSFSAATHRFQPNGFQGSRSYLRRHGVQFRRADILSHICTGGARACANFFGKLCAMFYSAPAGKCPPLDTSPGNR